MTPPPGNVARPKPRPLVLLLVLAVFAGLIALSVWQVQRLAWKTDLIARVEDRVWRRDPVPPPSPAEWEVLATGAPEYTKIRATGQYLAGKDALVQAVTVLGRGYWVMTPLQAEGQIILVNRGFLAEADLGAGIPAPETGVVEIAGLLRLSQEGGAFLRSNDPAADRWFSRDVAEIAKSRGLGTAADPVAPWFLDAGLPAAPGASAGGAVNSDARLVPGLTVIQFRNPHLGYALTWFALALVWAGGVWFLWRRGGAGED